MHEQAINWLHLGATYQDNPALVWYLFTFFVFLVGLIVTVRKPLMAVLESRHDAILKGIEEARLAKEESKKRLALYEDRLARLGDEIAHMKSEFKRQGELEREMIEKTARDMAQQISKDTQATITSELRLAQTALAKEVAHETIVHVQHQLSTQGISASQMQRLESNFSQEVGQMPN